MRRPFTHLELLLLIALVTIFSVWLLLYVTR